MKLTIKHNKKVYDNVELDTAGDVATFKSLVYSLTGSEFCIPSFRSFSSLNYAPSMTL